MKNISRFSLVPMSCLAFTLNCHAEGFVDDAKASFNFRNFYINRNFVNGSYH